jgi:hypothetical protein
MLILYQGVTDQFRKTIFLPARQKGQGKRTAIWVLLLLLGMQSGYNTGDLIGQNQLTLNLYFGQTGAMFYSSSGQQFSIHTLVTFVCILPILENQSVYFTMSTLTPSI